MSFWTFCALAAVFGIGLEMYRATLRHKEKIVETTMQQSDLSERIARIEQRLNNLETIIIEHDKRKSFDAAL
ncbi:MAG TPA: hypothetical protein PLI09_26815 [Candidatus Hydrogenedentes bacterium]|nr:hypothetical protein [Candidatus Hydrogenedentota bacterium]